MALKREKFANSDIGGDCGAVDERVLHRGSEGAGGADGIDGAVGWGGWRGRGYGGVVGEGGGGGDSRRGNRIERAVESPGGEKFAKLLLERVFGSI